MTSIQLNDGHRIGNGCAPYFVAELNTSHFGKPDIARDMIDQARQAGCHCVKFQSWTTDTLYSQSYYAENPIAKRFVKKYQLEEAELKALADYCHETGISFSSTPYSVQEAEFLLQSCAPPFIKVASMELNNIEFLDQLGRMNSALIVSTGMGDMAEIDRAVDVLGNAGAYQICLLHCVSLYPTPAELTNLHNIQTLMGRFPEVVVGYSDHSLGTEIPAAAVALGAVLIEKHFTLDNTKIGMDNQMATNPDTFNTMVQHCNNVYKALGNRERVLSQDELDQRANMRRSVVAARDLTSGTVLQADDIVLKRPGTGFPADAVYSVLGRKLQVDVVADHLILEEHLEV